MTISVVIPAKNEQDNIQPLVTEIVTALMAVDNYEIIYVDDGSDDNTYANIRYMAKQGYPQLKVVRHRFSAGQSTAIQTGVRFAKGELIVTLDADGQNDPADIPSLLVQARQFPPTSNFCIAGYRKQRKDTLWKRLQSRVANGIRSKILNDDTPDTGCGLKVFPRHTFLQIPYFDHMHRFLPALIRRLGGTIVVIAVNHRNREFGRSKYTMLGRLGVGIIDMAGVFWLQRRQRHAEVVKDDSVSI